MLFKRAVISSLLFLSSLATLLIFLHTHIRPSDRAQYQKLTKAAAELRNSGPLERNPTYQTRDFSEKDIWTDEREHFQMNSEYSTLSLKQKKGKTEAIENLEKLSFFLQNPSCVLRAARGTYEYPSHHFSATQVECTHELGTLLTGSAIVESKGKSLTCKDGVFFKASREGSPLSIQSERALSPLPSNKRFSFLENQKIEFFHQVLIHGMEEITARGGYAIYNAGSLVLHPEIPKHHCHLEKLGNRIDATEITFDLKQERISCQNPKGLLDLKEQGLFRFSSDKLLWQKQNDLITLNENITIEQTDKFLIQADLAQLTLQERKNLKLVEITNNVRLFSPCIQNKDSFAVADKMVLDPQTQTLTLSAESPKRVLFWQEGITLSAPEIRIAKDPITGQELIQGKGDIHFSFSVEEQNIMNQFISKYL